MTETKVITVGKNHPNDDLLLKLLNGGFKIVDGWNVHPNTPQFGVNLVLEKQTKCS